MPSYCLEYNHIDIRSVGKKKHVGVICQTATFTSLGSLTIIKRNTQTKKRERKSLVHVIIFFISKIATQTFQILEIIKLEKNRISTLRHARNFEVG